MLMRRKVKNLGPQRPDAIRPGMPGEACTIIFGHNVESGRVLMMFSVAAERLVFTPEEAEDVAEKLRYYAQAARGKKAS